MWNSTIKGGALTALSFGSAITLELAFKGTSSIHFGLRGVAVASLYTGINNLISSRFPHQRDLNAIISGAMMIAIDNTISSNRVSVLIIGSALVANTRYMQNIQRDLQRIPLQVSLVEIFNSLKLFKI